MASDPLKVARYREVARLRRKWIAQGKFAVGDATDVALLRHFLLEVEHTWGTDTKTWLDFDHYTPQDLTPMLDTKNYKVVEFSWQEKRQDLYAGIAALPLSLREQAQGAVKDLEAGEPRLAHPTPHPAGDEIETQYFIAALDPKNGSIHRLRNKKSGREWASSEHPLALFSYQTLSQQDYSHFFDNYVVSNEDWAKKDFGKPNIERFGAKSQEWIPLSPIYKSTRTKMDITCWHASRLTMRRRCATAGQRSRKRCIWRCFFPRRANDLLEFFLVSKAANTHAGGSLADVSSRCD